jgi:hypothetical protein
MAMEELTAGRFRPDDVGDADHVALWLADFEAALRDSDRAELASLFAEDSHWRDLLAFTWNITPHEGSAVIVDKLLKVQRRIQASNFEIAKNRTTPREVKRAGVDVIEAIFEFETAVGRGHGVVRLLAAQPNKAWGLMTSLTELKGFEEPINQRRTGGSAVSRNVSTNNWSDSRAREQAFADREPAVLIIGAGQAGLSLAARLRLLGVDTLVVDKRPRVGDVWRERFHSLAVHNELALNHLPYMPFPPTWPRYLPKDVLGDWLETYAWAMGCNVWTSTTLVEGIYEAAEHWNARVLRADGSERVLRPRHLVFASGIAGTPKLPDVPGLEDFKGIVLHTHGYSDGARWRGKNALVLGAGTSAHDIAHDLHGHGAKVKLVQRNSIIVDSIEAAGINHGLYYDEGLPLEDCDLIAASSTYPLFVRSYQMTIEKILGTDSEATAGLEARGYYGVSDPNVSGDVGLLQYEDIDRLTADGALMKSGRIEKADLLITTTGYQNQQEVVREILGDQIADKVGVIWDVDASGELANMFKPTPQAGLWFIGGGFAHARLYSHYLALQIRAREAGLLS